MFATSLWSTLLAYQRPIACVSLVCTLFYLVRTRVYPPCRYRPDKSVIKPRRDSSVRIAQMKEKASRQVMFSEEELDVAVRSFQYAVGDFSEKILYSDDCDLMEDDDENDARASIVWMCLRGIISQTAHKNHKDWDTTEFSADLLLDLLGGGSGAGNLLSSPLCRRFLHRVLQDGGWEQAERYAEKRVAKLYQQSRSQRQSASSNSINSSKNAIPRQRKNPTKTTTDREKEDSKQIIHPLHFSSHRPSRPWVVVICGLNGIRKTTAVYQPWFQELLHASLCGASNIASHLHEQDDLPHGGNSFFRQLDYMVATVACEDFRELYEKAGLMTVAEYSHIKDAIFARYRTLAEMIGIILLKEARLKSMNVMLETSGKDVASFRYVDHLFPNSNAAGSWEHRDYNKLIVHFTINDIHFAEQSVNRRMQREMQDGTAALKGVTHLGEEVIRKIISVNSGGPYGSEVLQAVQDASNTVMNKIFEDHDNGIDDEFEDWHMARISIRASESGWCACSRSSSSGEELKSFYF